MNEAGYHLILGNVQEDMAKEQDYLKAFMQNNVAGILSAVDGGTSNLKEIPFVLLDRVATKKEYAVLMAMILKVEYLQLKRLLREAQKKLFC